MTIFRYEMSIPGKDILDRINALKDDAGYSLRRTRTGEYVTGISDSGTLKFADEQAALDYLDRNDLRADRFTTESNLDDEDRRELESLEYVRDEITSDFLAVDKLILIAEDEFDDDWAQKTFREEFGIPGSVNLDYTSPFDQIDWIIYAGELAEKYPEVYLDDCNYLVLDQDDPAAKLLA